MPLPELQTTDTTVPNPIEALPAPAGEARVSAAYAGLERTLGISLETKAIGGLAGGPMVPYKDAKAQMEQNGYDASVLPADGLSTGELHAIMNQQSAIKRNEAIVAQSPGAIGTGVARFVGGAGDPIFLAAGPVIGRLGFAAKGMGLGGRLTAGAAEGATINGGYDLAMKEWGTAPGDRDIGTKQMITDMAVGGLVGGALHGAFGPRAPTTQPVDFDSAVTKVLQTEGGLTTDTGGLTKFGISQKAHPGLDIKNLSQDQATAIYKSDYWNAIGADKLPPDLRMTAFDAAVNQGVGKAKEMLAASGGDVNKFNSLREIEYRRLAASDPKKYGAYLNGWLKRIDAPEGTQTFGQRTPDMLDPAISRDVTSPFGQAFQAAETDSVFRTNPMKIADEHDDFLRDIDTSAYRGVQEKLTPGSKFTEDPDAQRILQQPLPAKAELEAAAEHSSAEIAQLKQQSQAAVQEAEHANTLTSSGKAQDTRGFGQFFHGTSRKISKLSDYPGNSESNIYGGGLYTTDAADVARGYSKKGGGKERTIYQLNKTGKEKLVDMEAPMSPDVAKIIKEQAKHHDIVSMATDAKEEGGDAAKTLREVYDSIRANSSGEGMPKYEVQELFDGLAYELQKEGYTGLQHTGGSNTGTAAHTVQIHWEPETQGHTLSERPDLLETPPPAEETPLQKALAEVDEAVHNEGHSPEMVKAIHAAVRCGVVKGLT